MPSKAELTARAERAERLCAYCGDQVGRGNRATCGRPECRLANVRRRVIARQQENVRIAAERAGRA
jgi:hypothetical protein